MSPRKLHELKLTSSTSMRSPAGTPPPVSTKGAPKEITMGDYGFRMDITCPTCGEVRKIHARSDNVHLQYRDCTPCANKKSNPSKRKLGPEVSRAKLSKSDARFIRASLRDGTYTQAELTRMFGVSHNVIYRIKNSKSYRNSDCYPVEGCGVD